MGRERSASKLYTRCKPYARQRGSKRSRCIVAEASAAQPTPRRATSPRSRTNRYRRLAEEGGAPASTPRESRRRRVHLRAAMPENSRNEYNGQEQADATIAMIIITIQSCASNRAIKKKKSSACSLHKSSPRHAIPSSIDIASAYVSDGNRELDFIPREF